MLPIPSLTNITAFGISFILLTFTYIIPLLSTIRAVHNRDKGSYQQWVTYFLLLFGVVDPLTHFFTFHPLFRLTTVLWLSLPRFQGAHYVYTQFIQVFVIEKYNVEERVDGEIRRVTRLVQRAVWNVVQDMGWCAVAQVGDAVGLVMSLMSVGDEDGRDEGEGDDEIDGNDEDDDDYNDDNDGSSQGVEIPESESDHSMQKDKPSRNPSNDTLASEIEHVSSFITLSSFRSSFGMYEDDSSFLDDDFALDCGDNRSQTVSKSYLRDLTQMLQNGLYVYASCDEYYGNGHGSVPNKKHNNRPFRLSLFSYHPSLSTTTSTSDPVTIADETIKQSYNCFVFGPEPTSIDGESGCEQQMANDSVILPLDDVVRVRKAGTHAIEIRTASSSLPHASQRLQVELRPALGKSFTNGTWEREKSADSIMSDKFVALMTSLSDDGNSMKAEVDEEDFVYAVIVLLDVEDRDTLFTGLRVLLKTFGCHSKCRRKEEKNDIITKEEIKSLLDRFAEGCLSNDDRIGKIEEKNENHSKEKQYADYEEGLSSTKILNEDEVVRPFTNKKCDKSRTLDNDTPEHENFFFGDLLTG